MRDFNLASRNKLQNLQNQEDDDDEEYFELNHASPDGIEEYGSEIEAHRIAMEDDEDDLDMLEGCAA